MPKSGFIWINKTNIYKYYACIETPTLDKNLAETVDILLNININIKYYITIITFYKIQPLQVLYYTTCMYNGLVF